MKQLCVQVSGKWSFDLKENVHLICDEEEVMFLDQSRGGPVFCES